MAHPLTLRALKALAAEHGVCVHPIAMRLAPTRHFAARGAFPRAIVRQVASATYHQVWWQSTKVIAYPDHAPQPIWDDDKRTYCDPSTGLPLRTWSETIDELDQALDEAVIAYVGSRMFP
jgi:hypothetical protein